MLRVRIPAAALALLACSLVAPDAAAYCRGLTQAGADPATTHACFDGAGAYELYWKNRCVGYSLQKDASRQVPLDKATQVAAEAFASWSAAPCSTGSPSIQAFDEGPVDCSLVQYNSDQPNQHVIVFRDDAWPYDDPNNTLALTTITFDATDGEIFDADMEINSHDHTIVADPPASPPAYDLPSILTHEAGHFLGLAHSTDATAVMYTFYRPGVASLASDDVAGICSIDVPDGTRSTSNGPLQADTCDPTPRHGFSTECAGANPEAGVENEAGGSQESQGGAGGCSVGVLGGAESPVLGGVVVAAVAFARRRRRRSLRMVAALWLVIGVGLASVGSPRPAQASVSIAVTLDDLLRASRAAAVVTPLEKRSAWESGRIFTYTRVRVDRLVAGELPSAVWVRTMGGTVDQVGQLVEGEPSLALGQASLVFLRTTGGVAATGSGFFVVTARAQGEFPIVRGHDGELRVGRSAGGGLVDGPHGGPLAREVIPERRLDDVVRAVAGAWGPLHG
jgi:hypothetical protein